MRAYLARLWRNLGFSGQGLKACWQTEWAFRLEMAVGLPLLLAAALLPVTLAEKLLLAGSLFLVVLAELANTAIETVINRISPERHPLSGKAKDVGSAMVLVALLQAGLVWCSILYGCLAAW